MCTVVIARATSLVAMSAGCGFLMHCGTSYQPQCCRVMTNRAVTDLTTAHEEYLLYTTALHVVDNSALDQSHSQPGSLSSITNSPPLLGTGTDEVH